MLIFSALRSTAHCRVQRFHAVGAPFTVDDLKHIESTIVHINPLSYGEFPDELIPKIKELNPSVQYLVADAQGFIRYVPLLIRIHYINPI